MPLIGDHDLAAISKSISVTATDVFVYDTRKDSDGGAWRKRTQHTSWYNETLNTSTRGSRKEFPAVAVIVAESNQITIYDGDDPDMPMWMVFDAGGSWSSTANLIMTTSSNLTSINSLNGTLCACHNSGYGLVIINFIQDKSEVITATSHILYRDNISGRNSGSGFSSDIDSNRIANSTTNDVAMTVLPNAPIDDATGLPIPTIAVACGSGTAGGLSVIKHDGTVVSKATTDAYVASVNFYGDNYLVVSRDDYSYMVITPWDSSDSALYPSAWTGNIAYFRHIDGAGTDFPSPSTNSNSSGIGDPIDVVCDNEIIHAADVGITRYASEDWTQTNHLGAYITSDYNTGWMHGDIKLAALSDTDDTNAGTNLVTNGTFDSTSNWSLQGAGAFSISSGTLNGDGTSGDSFAQQAVSPAVVETGKTYTVKVTVTHTSGSLYARVGNSSYSSNIGSTATHNISLTAGSTPTETILFYGNGWSGTIDNVEVILEDQDRSVNNNGLQVFGTVTKSAVATGADLVAYSGFSTSNYFQQPYNSDLDIGTGDIGIVLWFKLDDNSGVFYHRSDGSTGTWGSSEIIQLETNGTNFNAGIYTSGFGNAASAISVSISPYEDDNWHCMTFVRRLGTIELYIDAISIASGTMTTDVSGGSPKSWIGQRPNISRPLTDGSIALLRVSTTAPTAEQIKKIYEDEKVLFQENAKATLYGSSDAVTALAYDDDIELLHAGTSAGRSVFQGLRRVDNTTDGVGVAISASNGLVAED